MTSETTRLAGRYRVVRRLGSGGSGSVVLAEDEVLGREVAVKRLHGAEASGRTADRLRREAQIMASLRHANLVTVFDMLMEDDDVLLVMEYVPGETLADLLRDGPLDPWEALDLLEAVAAALDHAHRCDVVHRDVKPSNVLVNPAGGVKLADLGLATAAEITRITPPGTVLGTPAYMAPEQSRPGQVTPATDVFALASVAYEALSGELPRTGETALAILHKATYEPPPDLRAVRPGTPDAAAEALMRGMSADPAARQSTASELIADLGVAFGDEAYDPVAAHGVATYEAGVARGDASGSGGDGAPATAAAARRRALRESRPTRRFARSDRTPAPRERPAPRRPPDRRARMLALAALGVGVLAAVVALVVLAAGGGDEPQRRAASTPAPTRTAEATAAPEETPAADRDLSPTATVRSFYRRAAAGDFAGAWHLAGPGMRDAFGDDRVRFKQLMSSLQKIRFERNEVVEETPDRVTVQVETIATHTDRVDHCSGTLVTVRQRDHWAVDPAGLRCETG